MCDTLTSSWEIISTSELDNLEHDKSEENVAEEKSTNDTKLSAVTTNAENCDTDKEFVVQAGGENGNSVALITRLSQLQCEEEHVLKKTVQIRQTLDIQSELEEDENIEDFRDHKDWEQSDTVKEEIEKHDSVLRIGNGTRSNAKSRNKITKGFKLYWKLDHVTVKYNLDGYSKVLINNLIESKKMLKRVNYVISAERDSVLLHAHGNPEYPHEIVPKECVLRVFRLTGNVWNANQRRPIILLAERKMKNFLEERRRNDDLYTGIPCAEMITVKEHIHIFSFVGDNFLSYSSFWTRWEFQNFRRSLDLSVKLQKVVA